MPTPRSYNSTTADEKPMATAEASARPSYARVRLLGGAALVLGAVLCVGLAVTAPPSRAIAAALVPHTVSKLTQQGHKDGSCDGVWSNKFGKCTENDGTTEKPCTQDDSNPVTNPAWGPTCKTIHKQLLAPFVPTLNTAKKPPVVEKIPKPWSQFPPQSFDSIEDTVGEEFITEDQAKALAACGQSWEDVLDTQLGLIGGLEVPVSEDDESKVWGSGAPGDDKARIVEGGNAIRYVGCTSFTTNLKKATQCGPKKKWAAAVRMASQCCKNVNKHVQEQLAKGTFAYANADDMGPDSGPECARRDGFEFTKKGKTKTTTIMGCAPMFDCQEDAE